MSAARLAVFSAALASVVLVAGAGCALFRPPLTPAERLALDVQRLAEAPTDSAKTAVALGLVAAAGLTPLAGQQFTYADGRVVAGFVPGRAPRSRDTLVVVAAPLDSPAAVPLVAAGARMAAAAQRGTEPGVSVLVALWAPSQTPAAGLADVLAFPLWPRGAIRSVLVVGDLPDLDAPRLVSIDAPGGAPGQVADALARRVLDAASADLFPTPSDTLLTD